MTQLVRVVVIAQEASLLTTLVEGLGEDPLISVVGISSDADDARNKIVLLHPHVLVFADDSPEMDGAEFLSGLMPYVPTPVVMLSAHASHGPSYALRALDAGAVDFVARPAVDDPGDRRAMLAQLRNKVRLAATADVSDWKRKRRPIAREVDTWRTLKAPPRIIAVGASTGGTEAIRVLLKGLTDSLPAIMVVQHMPPSFTRAYAQRLNEECPQQCAEARDMEEVEPGRVYLAPGGKHMTIETVDGKHVVRCRPGARVGGHCPSVDVLFRSVAQQVGGESVGVILTGMGRDGAEGLLEMRKAGASTIGQDEDTCVVFGMPQEAHAIGAVERMAALEDIPGIIMRRVTRRSA